MSILSIGLERGEAIGEARALTELIVKKVKRGQTAEQIAEILEVDLNVVKKIYSLAEKYAPDYDVKKILEDYRNDKTE